MLLAGLLGVPWKERCTDGLQGLVPVLGKKSVGNCSMLFSYLLLICSSCF